MNMKKIRHYIPIVVMVALFIGADACSNNATWSGRTLSCSLPPAPAYPPLSNYINSMYITNQNGVSVPGPIIEYGVHYNLTIKFSVPIAGFPLTALTVTFPPGYCGGQKAQITFGNPNISSNGYTVIIPMTTPAYTYSSGGTGCSYQINLCSYDNVSPCNNVLNNITTVTNISYGGNTSNILSGGAALNIWLNNLDNDFPSIVSFIPGYPNPVQYASYPPQVPATGYFPPHLPITVVFSEIMMGGTNLPIAVTYERINSSGNVFAPSDIPEIGFTRTDTNNQTILTSTGLLEPASEYEFTFLSSGSGDLYHSMYGNQDSSGMPLMPYVNTVNCASGDNTCIENAYRSAITNGIPNDIRGFNTSLVGIEGPYYPAFSGFDNRNAIYVTPTSLSLNVTGSTGAGVSSVQFTAESYLSGAITPLGSTGVSNNQFSANVSFAGLSDGPYYFVAQETTDNSFDFIPVVKDTTPPSAPGSVIISPTDMSIDNMQDLNSVCATATTNNIQKANLYIVGPNNTSIYIASVTLPDNLSGSQGYQFCFSNVNVSQYLTQIALNDLYVDVPIAGIYKVQVTFVDFGGLESAVGTALLQIRPTISHTVSSPVGTGTSYTGCPGKTFSVYGNGFSLTNTMVYVNGVAWPTTSITTYSTNPFNGEQTPTGIALSTAMPSNATSGYITVATNGVASVPGTSPLTNTKVIVPWAIDKYVDTGYTPIGVSMALDQFDNPLIAATDGSYLYVKNWNGVEWVTPTTGYMNPLNSKPYVDSGFVPYNARGWTQGMSPKISLAIDQSGNPGIAYAKTGMGPGGVPQISINYIQGTYNSDGTYTFGSARTIDTIAPCTYVEYDNCSLLGCSYDPHYDCDSNWIDGNYSISLIYDNLSTNYGDPIITYRGFWNSKPAILSAEINHTGNIMKSEVGAVVDDSGGFYSDMKQTSIGGTAAIYDGFREKTVPTTNAYFGSELYAQRITGFNLTFWTTSTIATTSMLTGNFLYMTGPFSLTNVNNNAPMASTCAIYSGLEIWQNLSGGWTNNVIDSSISCPESSPVITSIGYNNSSSTAPAISYYDSNNGRLKMTTEEGPTWASNVADIGIDVGSANAIAIDSAGKADIAYSDNFDNLNGKLLFFQEANGSFISTGPSYINSPTSCDASSFSKVSVSASTINTLASRLIADSNFKINLPFPINLFYLASDSRTEIFMGTLYKNGTITIDQNNNPVSFTMKLAAPSGGYLDAGNTVDITIDLDALKSNILSVSANYMDIYDTVFSSMPHNFLLNVSSSGLSINYTVNGGFYGSVNIGNGSYLGLPYGLSMPCPPGSTSTWGGYACDIGNMTMRNFFTYFFPPTMRLGLALSLSNTDLLQTVKLYFSNNNNNLFSDIAGQLQQSIKVPDFLSEIKNNSNGSLSPSHMFITLSPGLQYDIKGQGTYQGTMNFSVPIYAELWGDVTTIGNNTTSIRVTCGPGVINVPISPEPYANQLNNIIPLTADGITSTGENMFALNYKHTDLVNNFTCSPHYTGNINQAGEYVATHWLNIPIPMGVSNATIGSNMIANMFPVPQILTYNLVKNTPLNVSLSTPQVINSMLLSTNGLDVYMGVR